MNEFIRLISTNGWAMLFVLIALLIICGFLDAINRTIFRYRIIMKYGYPPEHCDTFGVYRVKDVPKDNNKNDNDSDINNIAGASA